VGAWGDYISTGDFFSWRDGIFVAVRDFECAHISREIFGGEDIAPGEIVTGVFSPREAFPGSQRSYTVRDEK